jgi:four helix bundle protein
LFFHEFIQGHYIWLISKKQKITNKSQGSPTRPDAKTKIGISLKEMRELNCFLKIFSQLKISDEKSNQYLLEESTELKLILAYIINRL